MEQNQGEHQAPAAAAKKRVAIYIVGRCVDTEEIPAATGAVDYELYAEVKW